MISFVVPAHNEQLLIEQSLQSIHQAAQATGQPYEIIVVDDASTDDTAAIARRAGAIVHDVQLRQISAVRNAGARIAKGDVLVFVDADTILPAPTLQAALEALRQGAVGGGARVRFGQPMPWVLVVPVALFLVGYFAMGWAAGCFIFVTRKAFDAAGGFDEEYFASEEIHLSRALKKRGRFVVLKQEVISSSRKMIDKSPGRVLWDSLVLLLRGPGALRKREGLDLWYNCGRGEK